MLVVADSDVQRMIQAQDIAQPPYQPPRYLGSGVITRTQVM